jgi:succinate dehydrogenase / fumarate reductase cytochrome b subunit
MINSARCWCQSSIGKKWIVALTGLVLVAYVFGHLAGNLQIFLPDKSRINMYGAFLHSLGPLLWVIRAFLLACFGIHIWMTILLAIENRRARPSRYEGARYKKSSLAGRSMVISGLIVLCFVIFHILHFTAHVVRPDFDNMREMLPNGVERHDVFKMVVVGFQQPAASCFYILGMILLCMHLSHGFGSFVQTLGLNSSKLAPWLVNGGRVLAVIVCIGYISIPIAVMTGFLHL